MILLISVDDAGLHRSTEGRLSACDDHYAVCNLEVHLLDAKRFLLGHE